MSDLAEKTEKILKIAETGLSRFLLPERDGVYFRLRKSGGKLVPAGNSLRYTLITLIGVLEARKNGRNFGFPWRKVLETVKRESAAIRNTGDWGLWLWLLSYARFYPGDFDDCLPVKMPAPPRPDAAFTYELAWLYSGLLQLRLNGLETNPAPEQEVYKIFSTRFNKKTGLFWQRGNKRAVYSLRPQANFADQIYAAYALALRERFAGQPSENAGSQRVMDSLIHFQGPQGQWKWLYDVEKGSVVLSYPVYSVHQDGMAPMVLVELINQGFPDFLPVLEKSIDWVLGANELKKPLLDSGEGIIWRDVRFKNAATGNDYFNALVNRFLNRDSRKSFSADDIDRLMLHYESRPYHPGWVLYALSQFKEERR